MNYRPNVIALALFLAASPLVFAHADEATTPSATPPADGGPGHGHRWDPARMQQKFGLSDDQVTKLKTVMDEQKTALMPLWNKQRDLMKTLTDQVAKKAKDADIQTTLNALQTNREAMRTQVQQFRSLKQTILTPTQQAQMLLARMSHFRGRMSPDAPAAS